MAAPNGPLGSPSAGMDVYGTHEEGFPLVLWTVLNSLGYEKRPMYLHRNSVEEGVPRCVVNADVTAPAHRPDLPSFDLQGTGYHYEDTRAVTAFMGLTRLCARYPHLVKNHPIGLFPPVRESDPDWILRFQQAPGLVRAMPEETSALWVRCINAYHHLYQAMTRTAMEMARRTRTSFTHHVERDVRLISLGVDVTTKDAQIQELEARNGQLEAVVAQANDRELALLQHIQEVEGQLQQANDMVEVLNQQADPEEVPAAEAEDGDSDMDTEDDVPAPAHPPSPAGSGASVNDVDDF